MHHPHGTFSWADVVVPHLDRGAAFYGKLFGWETEPVFGPGGDADYAFFTRDGQVVAGMARRAPDTPAEHLPAMWTPYIAVDDVDPVAAAAASLGAAIIAGPTDVGDAGRMLYLQDPTGAAIGFWQARNHVGAELVEAPGSMTWFEVGTRDLDRAVEFYTRLLGWKTDLQHYDDGTDYVIFLNGDRMVAGAWDITDRIPDEIPAHWLTYFLVADTAKAMAAATEAGGEVGTGPMDTPYGRFAVLEDDQGAVFAVIEPPQAL